MASRSSGASVTGETSSAQMAWETFERAETANGLLILTAETQVYFYVPLAIFPEGVLPERLQAWIEQSVEDVGWSEKEHPENDEGDIAD